MANSNNSTPFPAQNALALQTRGGVWRAATLVVAASCLAVTGFYWQTAVSIVSTWYRSQTFSHGFLVIPVCAYLVWLRRDRLKRVAPGATPLALTVVAASAFCWLLGHLSNVLVVQQFGLVILLQGLIWTVLGTPVTGALLFPLAFLFFAVPFGEVFIPPLQDFTAAFTVRALELSGLPVLLEGRFIDIPSGRWEVAAACSGVRYLIASVALGFIYADIVYRAWTRRLAFLGLAIAVPIVANGLRAYGILMLAHLSDGKIAKGVDHLIYGWIFFGVVMFLLFAVGLSLREKPEPGSGLKEGDAGSIRASERPAHDTGNPAMPFSGKRLWLTATVAIVIAAAAPISGRMLMSRSSGALMPDLVQPSVRPPWEKLPAYTGDWFPQFFGAKREILESYSLDGKPVHLFIAYYVDEEQGAELVNSLNQLYDRHQWRRISDGKAFASIDGRTFSVLQTIAASASGSRLVWSWYWAGGQFTASPYYAKLLQTKARLLGGTQLSAMIALGTDRDEQEDHATERLNDFMVHSSLDTLISREVPH